MGLFWIICGFIGSVVAMLAVGTVSNLTSWMQGIGSIAAVIVSIIAVYLVAETLRETRDMASDQKAIGDAQTRAWVFADGHELEFDQGELEYIYIKIKNFGNTPAKNVKAYIQATFTVPDGIVGLYQKIGAPMAPEIATDLQTRAALAAMQEMKIDIRNPMAIDHPFQCEIDINVSYGTVMEINRTKLPIRLRLTNYADGRPLDVKQL